MGLVNHKCKFSCYGCDTKMKLDQIVVHEEGCLERTIICPVVNCKKEVPLRKFHEHAIKERCAITNTSTIPFGLVFHYYVRDFNHNENHFHRMLLYDAHNLTFYFHSSYLASKKCFIFYVMLPDDVETASKYNMKIRLIHPDDQKKLTYEGLVLSIEDLPDFEDDNANMKYWFVSYETLKPFFNQDILLIGLEVLA